MTSSEIINIKHINLTTYNRIELITESDYE